MVLDGLIFRVKPIIGLHLNLYNKGQDRQRDTATEHPRCPILNTVESGEPTDDPSGWFV